METRLLGNSDLAITPIGIGAWAIGGAGWNGSMGPQNDRDSIPAIHAALDHGLKLDRHCSTLWTWAFRGNGRAGDSRPNSETIHFYEM
jgi:hypothetical protein